MFIGMNSGLMAQYVEGHTVEEISEKKHGKYSRLSVPLCRRTSLGSGSLRLETALTRRQRAEEYVDG